MERPLSQIPPCNPKHALANTSLGPGREGNVHFVHLSFHLIGSATSEMLQYLASFVEPPCRGEETRRIRKKLDPEDENRARNALKSEQKPPSEFRQSIVDKGETEVDPISHADPQVVGNKDVA